MSIPRILDYHRTSQHTREGFAPSLGYLDWATQPDPFRDYDGAPREPLRLAPVDDSPAYDALYGAPAAAPPRPVGLPSLGAFFEHALALTAWKEAGAARWSLRVNPSSGNLHPTECYLVGAIEGERGAWHYAPKHHALERRCAWDAGAELPADAPLVLVLTSIVWRESWKYGLRALRYCLLDAGHAVGALRLAAASLGWALSVWAEPGDRELARLCGLDRSDAGGDGEREHAELALVLHTDPARRIPPPPVDALLRAAGSGRWFGRANRLSADHHPWPDLDDAHEAAIKPTTATPTEVPSAAPPLDLDPPTAASSWSLIRRRRSAVEMDGHTPLARASLARMLSLLLPRAERAPWDAWPWRPRVDLAFFAHRVTGLESGFYVLVRDPARAEVLRSRCRAPLAWEPAMVPLPVWRLTARDERALARRSSCGQDIAADSAVAFSMLAELGPALDADGAWAYRRLHWEAGLVGQVLYLEAEAAGLRATGIG